MSTLITDTLKMKGDGSLPVAFAKDVHVDYDDTDLETALAPATDEKLGRVKIGNNMDIDTDGTLSIVNRVAIDDEEPDDGSLTWVDNEFEEDIETYEDGQEIKKVIKISNDPSNSLSSFDDGLYAMHIFSKRPVSTEDPTSTWNYTIDGVLYVKGYPITLTKSITIYLDANGDDTYGDGSAAHPRKTLSGLPRDLGGYSLTVRISGDYRPQHGDFNIGFFAGGTINIYMVSNPMFYRLQIYGNSSRIYIYDAFTVDMSVYTNTNYTGWTQAFYIGGNNFVCITSQNATTKGTTVTVKACNKNAYTSTLGTTCYYRGLYAEGTALYVTAYVNLVCSNGRQAACFTNIHRADVRYITCKDSYYGLGLGYGKVGFDTITYSGNTTNTNFYHGGRAYTGAQSSVGNY